MIRKITPKNASIQKNKRINGSSWVVYILSCADASLYTGVTTNVTRRLHEHNNLKSGAKYTKSRRPVTLVYSETQPCRSTACRREYQIKQLSRQEKLHLILTSP